MSPSTENPQPPFRVLFLSACGDMGGAERSLCELLGALADGRGRPPHQPRARVEAQLCAPPKCALGHAAAKAGMPVHAAFFPRFRRTLHPFELVRQLAGLHRSAKSIKNLCREQQIDLLHANTDSAAIVAWRAARAARIPFVWHCRDLRTLHGIGRLLGRHAAAVIAISSAVGERLLSEGVPPLKIHRILNGIDLARFKPTDEKQRVRARGALGIAADAQVLLAAGAFVPWKRHELFFELLANLRPAFPGLVGLLAGSDVFRQNAAYEDFLQRRTRELALGPALKLLGQREDMPELFAAADVFVSTSEDEPFGRVLAEAGAAGISVLSTRSGGKSEIVEHEVTGWLASSGLTGGDARATLDDLSRSCARLLSDPHLRERMGRAARARVERLFDVRRVADEVLSLYDSIFHRRDS